MTEYLVKVEDALPKRSHFLCASVMYNCPKFYGKQTL